MSDSYYDSAEGETISYDRAMQELTAHGVRSWDERSIFLDEVGDKEAYNAQEVLRWLGY